MKLLECKLMRCLLVSCLLCGIGGSIFLSYYPYPVQSQSLQSPSYYNQLFLAFFKAKAEYKMHDATILKTLLMAQEHPSAKAKLAKLCEQFIKDEKIEDK